MAERARSDLTVVEYTQGISGAMCAKAMADQGADVIKVEPSQGDPTRRAGPFPGGVPDPEASGQFLYLNANKRGITLDVESRRDYDKLTWLLGMADVFVTDLYPRQSSELRVDYAHLQPANGRLVATYVTPFGYTGPYRDYKGSDLVVWHMGGMGYETPANAVTDLEMEPPLRGGGHQAEYLAGWTAAAATMAAVAYRETYGVGQMVDVSAMEAVANHIRPNFAVYSYDVTGLRGSRIKSSFKWIWPCTDGHISASFTLDHWWEALIDLMGRPQWAQSPDYATLQGRRNDIDTIEVCVAAWLAQYNRHDLYVMLQAGGIPCFPVLSTAEILEAPQYAARGFFVEQDHPVAGRVKHPGPPVRQWGTQWGLERPAPTLGQHSEEVFTEFGVRSKREVSRSSEGPALAPAGGSQTGVLNGVGEANQPLRGLRVLDFGWILSVPHCGAWLGTMGAEVIRVESRARLELMRLGAWPYADGTAGVNRSSIWNGLNYSKLDVTLNLAEPAAIELVRELVAVCDVVMENFATDVMERLGLGYETLREIRPDLIMLSGSTLGVTGPEREASGWGPNVCSYAGQPYISGYAEGPPVNQGGNWPDFLVGTIMAFSIISALRRRQRTGQGGYVEVSMAEVVAGAIPEAFLDYAMNGRHAQRMGNHDLNMSPHNVYPCRGHDQWIAIAVADEREWEALCRAIGDPGLARDRRFDTLANRKHNEEEIDQLVAAWTRLHSPKEATCLLQDSGIAAGPVMNVFDLMEDPHLKERGFVVEMDHPEVGQRTVAGLPAKFSAMPSLDYSPAPLLGQHNQRILGQLLGVGQRRLERLVEDKAIF